jgi:hypothetical protein
MTLCVGFEVFSGFLWDTEKAVKKKEEEEVNGLAQGKGSKCEG